MSKKEKNPPSTVSGSRGMTAAIIIIVAIIVVAGILYALGTTGGPAAVPPEECGRTVIAYVNTNLAGANATAALVSVTEKNGVYQIAARYLTQNMTFYATKDCTYLFSGIRDLKETPASAPSPQPAASPLPAASPAPVPAGEKSARPSVEMFVMSFCPYSVPAENAMAPVADLLGKKADIRVRFIATVQGTTADSVQSLHGPAEAEEDLRQLCIARNYPQKVWPYLTEFNARCYPVYQNATQLEACQEKVTAMLAMDNRKIETCAGGSEGLALLRADEAIARNSSVTRSPTIIVNGQVYNDQKTPEAIRQFICARFETPPAECSVDLPG